MPAEALTVGGRRFRTRSDYEAALRDQQKIERIKKETDLNNPQQVYELFGALKSGSYRFETAVGTDFDDEIYEIVEELKKQGITTENAKDYVANKKKRGRNSKKTPAAKASKQANAKPDQKPIAKADNKSDTSKPVNLKDYDANMQKQILAELKRQERRRKLVMALASLVAIACFAYFGVYYYYNARTNMDYEQLAGLKGSDVLSSAPQKNDFAVHKTGLRTPDVLDEYKTLYEKNKKLIGWLKIDDTIIDYPVVQTEDNEYYLTHNINQEYDRNGTIFLDKDCEIEYPSTNLILYGHHMRSGKMFASLEKYEDSSYWEKHPYIEFDTIYDKGIWQIMYVFRSRVFSQEEIVFKYYQFINANSEQEFDSNMQEMASMSLYDTGVTAEFGDRLLTLSTCDYVENNGRFVIVAKKVTTKE